MLLCLFLLLTILAFYLMPVRVLLRIGRHGDDQRLHLRLEALWGLWSGDYAVDLTETATINQPFSHRLSLPADWEGQLRRALKGGEEYERILHTVSRRVRCERLRLELRLGGNPALVGMATGLAYAVEGTALPFLQRRLNYASGEPRFRVVPLFREETLELSFDCILVARSGEIIRAVCLGLAKSKTRDAYSAS